jgi:hypothetical protein
MKNKRCSVDQRINGQRTYQWTTEVVPSSVYSITVSDTAITIQPIKCTVVLYLCICVYVMCD